MRRRRGTPDSGPLAATMVAAAALLVVPPAAGTTLAAQEDFRSSDPDRPLRVQDAEPVKLREWEAELGLRTLFDEGGTGVEGIVELKTGLFVNSQVGFELEVARQPDAQDGSATGLEGAGLHLLYNFNRETWSWPAFAIRADVRTPGPGAVGRSAWAGGLMGIATRSFRRARVHLNGGYVAAAGTDGGDYWLAGLGFDYPLGLFSKAILADLFAEVPQAEGPTRVWAGAGTRWQLSNRSVLDLGVATRLDGWDRGEANVELTVGMSRSFGIPALIRVPPYPDPRLD